MDREWGRTEEGRGLIPAHCPHAWTNAYQMPKKPFEMSLKETQVFLTISCYFY